MADRPLIDPAKITQLAEARKGIIPGFPIVDPATIAPLRDGKPDMFNYIPTRFVPMGEAKARGWTHFFDGGLCRYGHKAPHFVSNPRLCVDCKRLKQGMAAIGARDMTTPAEYVPTKRAYTQRVAQPDQGGVPAVSAPRPIEPDQREKRFLTAYAEVQSIDAAAASSGLSKAEVMSRMCYSAVFKAAVNALEDKLGIKQTPPAPPEFVWDDEKRERLLRTYVNTGSIQEARDAILVTPYDYYQELESNTDFANAVAAAEPLAHNVLEEVGIKLAINGSDKLLAMVLKAKKPEYRDSLKLDLNKGTGWDDNRERRLQQLITEATVIDARFEQIAASEESRTAEPAGGAEATSVQQPNSDLL